MNKEEYKAMKDAWARSVNNKDYKPYKDKKYGNKIQGKISSVHYLVYNILREMHEERGFEPVGEGFIEAKASLDRYKFWLERGLVERVENELLLPFEKLVTIEHLRSLL